MTEYDPEKPLWSIMTKSRGGTVSVIRDLTLEQARRTYERLDPWYGQESESLTVHRDFLSDGCLGASSGGSMRHGSDGDIEIREVFGPPGWTSFDQLEHWPKHYAIYTDDKWNVLPAEYQDHPERAAFHRQMQGARKPEKQPLPAREDEPEVERKDWFAWMKP